MSKLDLEPNATPARMRRKSAGRELVCGLSTLKRRERAGLLTPIRDVEGGAVYYSTDQVAALAAGRKPAGGQS